MLPKVRMARTSLVDGIFDFKSQGPPSTFSEIPVRGGLEGFPSSHINVGSDTGLQIGYPRGTGAGFGIPINSYQLYCRNMHLLAALCQTRIARDPP
jgi:hypothetical protein